MIIHALTIVRGRELHLQNQARGWMQSVRKPDRWIIVGMDEDIIPPDTGGTIDVITERVDTINESLPLAKARNRAAQLSDADAMVFLDVDCIPSPNMLTTFEDAIGESDRLWMGSPRYLPAGATTSDWSMPELREKAIAHPYQPRLTEGEWQPSTEYEKFWSLCFATTPDTFQTIGGFSEDFAGYGGEDTDFAFAAREAGVPFGFAGAMAYHQHHAVCKPPLNHFDAIIRNAIQFRRRWDCWPMESWLNAFARHGLIRFDADSDTLELIQRPTNEQIQNATVMTPAGF
ncbi:glycosyltransferase family 2 protein [Rhodopirellula sallentina]|uniref:Sugar transferase n=1 Tax=Rhodopirellula sallentina SM41 TaxID=1263870 RepID=M5TVS5_9BACT|nr:galactosyltransferase-related protein [Rhodopirellula sallentina]EMI53307.1 sugar transferase [Rhodopirellula sallentina SM41]